jgi:hypothetical protein
MPSTASPAPALLMRRDLKKGTLYSLYSHLRDEGQEVDEEVGNDLGGKYRSLEEVRYPRPAGGVSKVPVWADLLERRHFGCVMLLKTVEDVHGRMVNETSMSTC